MALRLLFVREILWGIFVAAIVAAPIARADLLRTVALTGRHAPGTAEDDLFEQFYDSAPVLNNAGKTAFRGKLAIGLGDVTAGNDYGIWSEEGDSLSLVARDGAQGPGLPDGAAFANFTVYTQKPAIVMNESGQIAFDTWLQTGDGGVTSLNSTTLWSGGTDDLTLVARSHDPAPGTPAGANFSSLEVDSSQPIRHAFNDLGQTAFVGRLRNDDSGMGGVTTSNNSGIWSGSAPSPGLLAREGDHAPGTPDGTSFNFFSLGFHQPPLLNNLGQTVFPASLRGDEVTPDNDTGIWIGTQDGLRLVARTGFQAPDAPDGVHFSELRGPDVNDAGHVAFAALLDTGSSIQDGGVWRQRDGNLAVIAASGMQAPGLPTGIEFFSGSGFGSVLINRAGDVAFRTNLVDTTNGDEFFGNSIWAERDGVLSEVIRAPLRGIVPPGQEFPDAPGLPEGTKFEALLGFAFNATGQVAFRASTTGPGGHGIWAQDRSGKLRLIVLVGSELDVDNGPGLDLRTVASLDFITGSGNEDGRASAFNDRGQIAFRARFTDGSEGIFVSSIAAIPEPTCWAQSVLAIGMAFYVRKRFAAR